MSWTNSQYDGLWQAYNTTLDRSERIDKLVLLEEAYLGDKQAFTQVP